MGLDDLFQLLIAFAVLYGLFGTKKKKKLPETPETRPQRPATPRPRQPQPRPRPTAMPQPRTPPPRRFETSPKTPVPAEAEEGVADELYRILTGELERRRDDTLEARGAETAEGRNRFEEIRPVEEVTEVEAYSLETLEPAGGTSHTAFHKKYMEPAAPPPATRPAVDHRIRRGGPVSLREVVVWSEILGPPRGML